MVRVAAVALACLVGVDAARLSKVKKHSAFSDCGIKGGSTRNVSMQIVNGQDASPCEWRWQVGLKNSPTDGKPYCGGMLIDAQWVLTAAHCGSRAGFYVVAGDWKAEQASGKEQYRRAMELTRHPNYDPRTTSWDYAIAKLDAPFDMNECVGTVCLPTEGVDVTPGQSCWITGWGTLASNGDQPNTLQEAMVKIISNDDCTSLGGYSTDSIDDSMICAQGRTASGAIADACQGDSGGPLVCESSPGTYSIYGATSWGVGCAGAKHPGIWARVHLVLDWIDEILSDVEPPQLSCPDSAVYKLPDGWGDCVCKEGTKCSTDGVRPNCPSSGGFGGWGGAYFYPNCKNCQCLAL